MTLEFQSRWLRLWIEILPPWPAIRRYRVVPAGLDGQTDRQLRRRIARQMRRVEPEAAP